MLRKTNLLVSQRQIRLVVHGALKGQIDPIFCSLAEELGKQRNYPVQIEALTSSVMPEPQSCSVWLVPLLLLPGHHVCRDLPRIRRRLQSQGINVIISGVQQDIKKVLEEVDFFDHIGNKNYFESNSSITSFVLENYKQKS